MAQGKTILVVDDEFKIVDVLKSYLEKAGYVVVCAYSGSEALKMFEKHSPALVVLDLMLPDMAGEDVCRAIRQESKVPIIMLTAKGEESDVVAGLELGADDYVVKPFSPRVLAARIRAALRRGPSPTTDDAGAATPSGSMSCAIADGATCSTLETEEAWASAAGTISLGT